MASFDHPSRRMPRPPHPAPLHSPGDDVVVKIPASIRNFFKYGGGQSTVIILGAKDIRFGRSATEMGIFVRCYNYRVPCTRHRTRLASITQAP